MAISLQCSAMATVSCLWVGILAARVRFRDKLVGMALGTAFLIAVNQLRLVQLFWMGVHRPHEFEMVHVLLWPILEAAMLLLVWYLWWCWLPSREPCTGAGAPPARLAA